MATFYQHLKFFRFSSPINVFEFFVGELSEISWMIESLKYIDFSKEALIKESFLVMHFSKGGFDFETLCTIPFDDFKLSVKEALRIEKLVSGENNNG